MDVKNNLIKELNRSTRQFVEYMKTYAAQEINSPFSGEKWNMVQLIEHVILTDQTVIALLPQSFHKRKNGHYSKYQMRDMLLNRREKIKNPKMVTPKLSEDKSITEWLEDFKKQRQYLIDQVSHDQYDLESEEAYPHFELGLLTRRDWLYLVCFHSDRHIAQVQEMLFCT